jgi:hypothetical protein
MVIVFTTNMEANNAGLELTRQFNSWLNTFPPDTIKTKSIHSNSNLYGWMLVVMYEQIKP